MTALLAHFAAWLWTRKRYLRRRRSRTSSGPRRPRGSVSRDCPHLRDRYSHGVRARGQPAFGRWGEQDGDLVLFAFNV